MNVWWRSIYCKSFTPQVRIYESGLRSQNSLLLHWKTTFTLYVPVFVQISLKIVNTWIMLSRLKATFHINYTNKWTLQLNWLKKSTDDLFFHCFCLQIFNELLPCASHCVFTICLYIFYLLLKFYLFIIVLFISVGGGN